MFQNGDSSSDVAEGRHKFSGRKHVRLGGEAQRRNLEGYSRRVSLIFFGVST
jgi:hypothetical protein